MLQKELDDLSEAAKVIMNEMIIEPQDLFTIQEYKRDLLINSHQLYIYQTELDFVMKQGSEAPKIAMIVKNQPYPCVVKQKEKKKNKNKNDDSLTVVLLKGKFYFYLISLFQFSVKIF